MILDLRRGCLLVFLIIASFLMPAKSEAVPAAPNVYKLKQANGTIVKAKQWGDEWMHGWETEDGYSIVFDEQLRSWTYAVHAEDGRLASSSRVVGVDSRPEAPKKLKPSGKARERVLLRKAESVKEFPERAVPTNGTARIPVILINFSGRSTTYSSGNFNTLLFGTGNYSMKDYYEEVSYGAFSVSAGPGGVSGWYTASNTHEYYGANDADGYDAWPGTLVREAAAAADVAGFNFAPYDQDGDCYVDVVMLVHQGSGEEASPLSDDIWSHRWNLYSANYFGYSDGGVYETNDNCTANPAVKVKIDDYVMQPEILWGGQQTVGVFAHEYGHALGLPDLYDTDYTSEAVGEWSLMAGGSWASVIKSGDRPAHMDAWSKYFLGWVTPTEVSGTLTNESVIQASAAPDVYKLVPGDPLAGEYFLLENRQKTGFDAGLPGAGLLIWHIDGDRLNEALLSGGANDSECYPGDPSCYGNYAVKLVQADDQWDLEQNVNSGDNGDPYPGASNNRTFNATSTPDSHLYNGNESGVSVSGISSSASTMTATMSFVEPPVRNLLLNPGFERGQMDWTEYSLGGYDLILNYISQNVSDSHSGAWFSWLGGYDNGIDYLSQDMTIPPAQAYLRFWFRIGSEETSGANDFMSVELRNPADNGLLTTLDTFSNLDETSGWQQSPSYDLSSFKGQTVRLRFACTTNSSVNTNFFIDNIALNIPNFADVPSGYWADEYILAIYDAGITMGCGQNPLNYCPSSNVTRPEMAAFIIRALHGDTFAYSPTPYFSDVPTSHPFFRYIQRLKEDNITMGCTATRYCPSNYVTRQEMAAFIIRARFGEPFSYTPGPYFTDVPEGSPFYTYIQRLKDEGITAGCAVNQYCPNSYVTRAEMAAFLARAFLGMP